MANVVISLLWSPRALVIAIVVLYSVAFVSAQTANVDDNAQSSNLDNSITHNLPLTVEWRSNDGRSHTITAYRSILNDKILEEVNSGNYRRVQQLRWISYGKPQFVRTKTSRASDKYANALDSYFHFTSYGFHSFIQMLTDEQQALLAEQASKETNLTITTDQIMKMQLTKFECSLIMHDEKTKKKRLLRGAVDDFNTYPLQIDFEAHNGTIEREHFLHAQLKVLKFKCHLSMHAKVTHANTLSITSQQIQDIRLGDKLFGEAKGGDTKDVYVTRNQMSALASEMYSSLNIMEDYELPESTFSDAFVEQMVGQLAIQQFSQVPIDTVLASLSQYTLDFSGDLTADRIKSDLGKVFKVEGVGDKRHITLSSTNSSSQSIGGEQTRGNSEDINLGFSYNLLEGNVGSGYSEQLGSYFSHDQSQSRGTLSEQLSDINRMSQNVVQWAIEGDKVIPKSLNVAKLSRTRLSSSLNFTRIRRQSRDAAVNFPITIYLHTDRTDEQPLFIQLASSGNQTWKQVLMNELRGVQQQSLENAKLFVNQQLVTQKAQIVSELRGVQQQSLESAMQPFKQQMEKLTGLLARNTIDTGLRLSGGSNGREGRLEVFYNNQWGTVCDDFFDNADAVVACRSLGYRGVGGLLETKYGPGNASMPIWLDRMQCRGDEESFFQCPHRGWGTHGCGHSEDVSITCNVPSSSGCPHDFINLPRTESCYKFVADAQTWTSAASRCRSLHPNAHLVFVNSADENRSIKEQLRFFTGLESDWWMGGQRIDPTCQTTFMWKTPPQPFSIWTDLTFTNWSSFASQPDYFESSESCMSFWHRMDYDWNDLSCGLERYYVCELTGRSN